MFFGHRERQWVKKTKYTEKLQLFENGEWKDIPEEVVHIKALDKNPDEQKYDEELQKAMQDPEYKKEIKKMVKKFKKELKDGPT